MSIRLEMLQVARLAPNLLGESAALVGQFIASQQNPDGGFQDRSGVSDLYYTVFALESALALRGPFEVEPVRAFLRGYGAGGQLDFVHLCALIRCWAAVLNHSPGYGPAPEVREGMGERLKMFRAADGGFHVLPGQPQGTCYGNFLGLAACQDLGVELPEPLGWIQSFKRLERPPAWANETGVPAPSTNATAAAITALSQLHLPINRDVGAWLLSQVHAQGGFRAAPGAPLPDLLSTATSLHALAALEVDFGGVKERCLDFIDSLWTNEGGFHGHWSDEALDCEYTFYGLLALGHLSL